jgi:hypothetical protein
MYMYIICNVLQYSLCYVHIHVCYKAIIFSVRLKKLCESIKMDLSRNLQDSYLRVSHIIKLMLRKK